jgi:hypothetical protein
MANVYWVGGSGVWNTVTNTFWSSTPGGTSGTGSVPTVNDDVFFDRAQTYSVTMTGALNCRSITVSAGTVTFATGTAPTLTVAGSMSLVAGTVWSSSGAITFNSATTGKTITTNGTTISADITFNNATGGWSLGSALTVGSPGNVTLTTGALNLNGFDLTLYRFTSSNTNTRSIAFGSNYIIGTGVGITVANLAVMTNCTFTGDGGFKINSSTSNKQIHCGSTSNVGGLAITPGPNLFITNGSGTVTTIINDFSSFNKIDFTGFTGSAPSAKVFVDTLILSSGGTFTNFQPIFTRTQTWTAQFSKQLAGIGVSIPDGTLTLDGTQTFGTGSAVYGISVCAGTLDLGGFDVTCGAFDSSYTNTRSVAFGSNNIVLANTNAAIVNLSVADATNFSWTGTGGFTAAASVTRTHTFGTTGGSITNAPNFTLTGSGTSVQTFTSSSWFNNLNFGSTAFTVPTTTLNIDGNVTLSSAATYTNLSLNMRGTGSITSNGKTMSQLTVNTAGTITLPAALTSGAYTQTAGTLDFAGFNFTTGPAIYQGGTLSNIGTIACTTFSISSGTFTLTQGTITPSTSFTVNGTFNYNGGTLSPVPTFTQSGGTVTLGQSYALTATGLYGLTAGTLNLNGYNLTTGIFSSFNTNARSVAFDSGTIYLTHTTAGTTVLLMETATNFTWTGTGGFSTAMSVARTVDFGSLSNTATLALTAGPNLFVTSGASTLTLNSNSSFNNLNFTGSTCAAQGQFYVNTLTLATGGTYTSATPIFTQTQTLSSQFSKAFGGAGLSIPGGTLTLDGTQTYTATAIFVLYAGTLDLGGFDFTIGAFGASATNTRAIAFGANNIILSTTTAAQTNLGVATATGFSWTGTGGFRAAADITRTFTFGTTGGTAANAPNLTLTGSGTAIQTFTTGSWFDDLNFGTTGFNPGTTALNVSSLTLSPLAVYPGLSVTTVGTGTITCAGNAIVTLTVNCPGGTTTLSGPLGYTLATATTTLTAGTLDLNGNDLTTGIFSSSNSNVRAIAFGSNYIDLATTTLAATNLAMGTATGFTCTGTGGFRAAANITRSFTCGTSGGNSAGAPNLFLTTGTAVQTITTGSFFNTLNFGTTAFATGTRTVNINSLVLSSGGVFTGLTALMVGTGSINGNGKAISALTINHTGTTTITGTLSTGITSTCTHTSGTLDLNGFNLTCGVFSSSNTNTRSVIFGSNFIFTTHTTTGTTNVNLTLDNYTFTGAGGFSATMSTGRNFLSNVTTMPATGAPNLFLTSGAGAIDFNFGLSHFKVVDFGTCTGTIPVGADLACETFNGGSTGGSLRLYMYGTGTLSNFTNISSIEFGIIVPGVPTGATTLLTGGNVSVNTSNYYGGTINLNGFTFGVGRLLTTYNGVPKTINFGSGFIDLISTGTGEKLGITDATDFSATGTGGFRTSNAASGSFNVGTVVPPLVAPNMFVSNPSVAVSLAGYFDTVNFSGQTGVISQSSSGNCQSLILSASASVTYTTLDPIFYGTGTITTNGKSIRSITINGTGTTTLAANVTTTSSSDGLILNQGTIDLAGYTLTMGGDIKSLGAAATRVITSSTTAGVIACNGSVTVTNGSGFTGSNYSIRMTQATAKTFAGGGGGYGTLVQAGAGVLSITGNNSFTDIQATTRPSTIRFGASTIQTLSNFTLSGTAGNLVTINSLTSGTQFNLSKSSGTVTVDYLSITDSNVTGGAYWGTTTSTFVSNNTGWNVVLSVAINGQFMAFFF